MRGAASQVLIVVLGLVVIGFSLLFGYKAITSLSAKSQEAEILQFRSVLSADVRSLASQYQSTKVYGGAVKLATPGRVRKVCFVDSVGVGSHPEGYTLLDHLPVVRESVQDQVDSNVFLLRGGDVIDAFSVKPITVSDAGGLPLWCVNITAGHLPLRLEGRGNSVLVSP